MEITFNKKRNSSLQVHDVLYYATVVNGVTTKPEVWGEIVDMYDLADHYDKLSTCMLSGSHSIEHKVFILILKDLEYGCINDTYLNINYDMFVKNLS